MLFHTCFAATAPHYCYTEFSLLLKSAALLASPPQDFTYVCPTEIIAFSDRAGDFEKINTQVIGERSHSCKENAPRAHAAAWQHACRERHS